MKTGVKIIIYISAVIFLPSFYACSDFRERDVIVPDPNIFTIRFETRGGTQIEDITEEEGKEIILPATTFLGWVFQGWYSERDGGEFLGNASERFLVKSDTTMFAHWKSVLPKDVGDSIINGILSVFVEAGTFTMGSPEDEEGRHFDETQREITLTRSFWISKYPITNQQFGGDFDWNFRNHPVVDITWQEAYDFAQSKGGFLPTEAQWEFAARGGNKSRGYIFSGSNNLSDVGWYWNNSARQTHEVGLKQPNELGIHDMSGNVHEWVYDYWNGIITSEAATDPRGPDTGDGRICRGGSWFSQTRECRVADRPFANPDSRYEIIGFRIAFWSEE